MAVGDGNGNDGNSLEAAFQRSQTSAAINDLLKSGLSAKDIKARELTAPERATTATGSRTQGYVIPYFNISGAPLTYYRVKVLTPELERGLKYKQPKGSQNHLYFPPNFRQTLMTWIRDNPAQRCVLITEGEKKSGAATKAGFPCVGLGGVDSWRSRTLVLPTDTEVYRVGKGSGTQLRAKLPAASKSSTPELMALAVGFGDLIDLVQQYGLTVVIVYDSDRFGTLKAEVQRAAAALGYELRFLGIPTSRIKQIILPDVGTDEKRRALSRLGVHLSAEDVESLGDPEDFKTGLDDFLVTRGPAAVRQLITDVLNNPKAFPRHPNPKGFINTALEGGASRKESIQIASVITTELDARGLRLREKASGRPYYYDGDSHRLMPAVLLNVRNEVLHEAAFGSLLYKEFALSGNDKRVLTDLASQFTGEEPVLEVVPRRILALITENEDPTNPDGVAVQISDSAFIAVSPDREKAARVMVNGECGLLFEQNQVDPIDVDRFQEFFDQFLTDAYKSGGHIEPWWLSTLSETNLGRTLEFPVEYVRKFACCLFYISPYLQRWRDAQMPVEITTGEAGSGKSSLYSLRLQILTGRPFLRNAPSDIRDWHASIASGGGLHVTDNVNFVSKDLHQKISDEICRIITEPSPFIEMRQLYTEATLMRIPVNCVFGITAIKAPFRNADLIQRAALFEMQQIVGSRRPDGDWVRKQLDSRGGREAWLAHHLVFLHLFLRYAQEKWNDEFPTEHRLAHFEQCLTIAADILGIEDARLGEVIRETQMNTTRSVDWTLLGISAFVVDWVRHGHGDKRFFSSQIASWASTEEEFEKNVHLTTPHRLTKYLNENISLVYKSCGVRPAGRSGNQQVYAIQDFTYVNKVLERDKQDPANAEGGSTEK